MRGRLAFTGYLFAAFVAGAFFCAYMTPSPMMVTVSEPGDYTISIHGRTVIAHGMSAGMERRIACEIFRQGEDVARIRQGTFPPCSVTILR